MYYPLQSLDQTLTIDLMKAKPRRLLQASVLMGLFFWRTPAPAQVELWLTSPDESARFEKQTTSLRFGNAAAEPHPAIEVDESRSFQTIDGFGFCLTGGS